MGSEELKVGEDLYNILVLIFNFGVNLIVLLVLS